MRYLTFRAMPRVVIAFTLLMVFTATNVVAQNITINRISENIKIDGVLDEPAWLLADSAKNFMQYFPYDSSMAVSQTTARIMYDDQNIYVSAVLYNPNPDRKYVTPSLRRDFFGDGNDSFSVLFDPFQDRTNAVIFGINPFGVRREGLISNGGRIGGGGGRNFARSFSLDWDNKWYGEAKQYDGYWTVEMAIPLKTLRFGDGQEQWNVNFYRIDSDEGERSTWSPIPRNLSIINITTMRQMDWDSPTEKPGTNISAIPYISAGTTKNFEDPTLSNDNFDAGFDLKYAVTSGLNLDVTVNPDFSQVEVDQQVTNLDRFEIFFPERRQFFLENADLFASYGNQGTRPFFSRRIGVARNESTGQNVQNPIPIGARLSGKVNQNLRLGFLNMQTGEDEQIGLPSYNYGVLSLQQKVFAQSNINFMFVNKETFQNSTEFDAAEFSEFNRTIGTEYNLASPDNVWNGKFFYHKSINDDNANSTFATNKSFATGFSMNYNTTKWSGRIFSQAVGANYNPEVGFVRRRDIRQLAMTMRRVIFPESGSIQRHGPGLDFDMVGNSEFGFLDWDVNLLYDVNWKNTSNFSVRLRRQFTYLFNEFDPTGLGRTPLAGDTEYTNNLFIMSYRSDQRKKFSFNLNTRSGGYFTGHRWNLDGSVNMRYQPLGFTSIAFSFNHITLPGQNVANLFLIGPRFDFTFTKKLFWTTFVQYNSQIENLNINSRLQWRYNPVSDFFLVYTDNYVATTADGGFIDIGQSKVRSLVFKLTYWLNF